MHTLALGRVRVDAVVETAGPTRPTWLFPAATPEALAPHLGWLAPHFVDPEGRLRQSVHTFVIRSSDLTVLVDTCIGNDKDRGGRRPFHMLRTGFLEDLRAAGVAPEAVDVVICTHLHVDHVGWNTSLNGRDWVPTFPNARYLICEPDFLFWDPIRTPRPPGDGNQNVFEDSVQPLQRAGLIDLWAGEHPINSELVLQAEPGHTPGSSVLRLQSGGTGALFVGDILHSPVQIGNPDINSCFCEDPAMARAARRRLLAEAADRSLLVFPGHFGGHSACHVDDGGDGAFIIRDWDDLARI
jgi:glyoxylase-like metal-dependent hydrolase (beta-lactamase superfamily II)